MATYDCDGSGLTKVVNDNGVVEFDRNLGINRSGWSTRVPAVTDRFKNITEKTGKADIRHGTHA